MSSSSKSTFADDPLPDLAEAEAVLSELANVFIKGMFERETSLDRPGLRLSTDHGVEEGLNPNLEEKYRALLEQIPAVVFMAYLDRGIGEAYVSPQIEAALGFSREEWLEDPVRWYRQIHPADKQRWSIEAAQMFLSGKPLRSAYRVIARDGQVIWFHCDARMMRSEDGKPSFIHGVAFDITDLKRTEEQLQEERNVASAILDTVGALVVVLDHEGRVIRFNRACERTTGYSQEEVEGKCIWDLFLPAEDVFRYRTMFEQLRGNQIPNDYETYWITRDGTQRLIAWSTTVLPGTNGGPAYIIASGTDITERKRLEKAVLDISAREQRRIGQDLHDGLGQHLTGIAFMTKVQQQKLAEKQLPEAVDAAKIVQLVNEAIHKTRELAQGLVPVVTDKHGLMSALQLCATEVEDLFGIECCFQCEEPVFMHDYNKATHLYHIAQEAVNNAIKHGHAKNIVIRLYAGDTRGTLMIQDDGEGIAEVPVRTGMGLHIMNYRAGMIGGLLEIRRDGTRGTFVVCHFPVHAGQ
jgi:PAS domain S-box-containing protein